MTLSRIAQDQWQVNHAGKQLNGDTAFVLNLVSMIGVDTDEIVAAMDAIVSSDLQTALFDNEGSFIAAFVAHCPRRDECDASGADSIGESRPGDGLEGTTDSEQGRR